MYRCERYTIKKAKCWIIYVFKLWCWRILLRVPRTARRSNQSILKEISPECSLEGLMLKLKLQYFGHVISQFSSVQSLSRVRLFSTRWIAARQASLSITNSWSSPKHMCIESVMPSSHLILCCPLLFLPSIFPNIMFFSKESTLPIKWPKYWRFSFNIHPSNEHPGLISFRMDWLDLLAVLGTLKSLLQHHSSKASVLLIAKKIK